MPADPRPAIRGAPARPGGARSWRPGPGQAGAARAAATWATRIPPGIRRWDPGPDRRTRIRTRASNRRPPFRGSLDGPATLGVMGFQFAPQRVGPRRAPVSGLVVVIAGAAIVAVALATAAGSRGDRGSEAQSESEPRSESTAPSHRPTAGPTTGPFSLSVRPRVAGQRAQPPAVGNARPVAGAVVDPVPWNGSEAMQPDRVRGDPRTAGRGSPGRDRLGLGFDRLRQRRGLSRQPVQGLPCRWAAPSCRSAGVILGRG